MLVKVKRVGHVEVPLPKYQTEGAAGMDLHAAIGRDFVLDARWSVVVPSGLAFQLPIGYEGQVRPRSGWSMSGIVAHVGTIDSDYRGEVGVILTNASDDAYLIRALDRIAQLVIAPVVRAKLELVDELDETERGERGFGSTGR